MDAKFPIPFSIRDPFPFKDEKWETKVVVSVPVSEQDAVDVSGRDIDSPQ